MDTKEIQQLEAILQKSLSLYATNDKLFLLMAYWVIFEREADIDGLNCWLDQLSSGVARLDVIGKMIASDEFQKRTLGEHAGNSILHKLQSARMQMVRTLLPPAKVVLDLGGYSASDQRGALLQLGYSHLPDKLYIRDLHPEKMMFPGPEWPVKVQYKTCEIEYAYGNMTDLSCFQERSFDLIWSGESIEHITLEECEQVLEKIYKLLKPGGKFALDTPNRRATQLQFPDRYIHPEHKIEYYYHDLLKLLRKHNFKIIQSKGIINLSKSIETSKLEYFNNEFVNSESLNDDPDNSYCFYICCMRSQDL